MKIVSYNVNGIRAAQRKGFEDWVEDHDFDIICIQESKAQPGQVNWNKLHDLGYEDHWYSAQKKGYSGVITLSKHRPQNIQKGVGIEKYDSEGRVMQADFDNFTLINSYFPSGTTGDIRQQVKMEFLDDFYHKVKELKETQPNLIIVGDYNIAHTEIDIHDPVRNKKTSGFLPEEREWMSKWFELGFVDSFRHVNPEKVEYSWWSYRSRARDRNKGWRLDYQSVSQPLADRIVTAHQLTDVVHSDHCPVLLEIDI